MYSTGNPKTPCAACAAGRFSANKGADVCKPCPGGMSSEAGAASCTACPAGKFAATSNSPQCSPCQPGTFNHLAGAMQCKRCKEGMTSSAGANKCVKKTKPETTQWCPNSKPKQCKRLCPPTKCKAGEFALRTDTCCATKCVAEDKCVTEKPKPEKPTPKPKPTPGSQCDELDGPMKGPCPQARCKGAPKGCKSVTKFVAKKNGGGGATCCPKLCYYERYGKECRQKQEPQKPDPKPTPTKEEKDKVEQPTTKNAETEIAPMEKKSPPIAPASALQAPLLSTAAATALVLVFGW